MLIIVMKNIHMKSFYFFITLALVVFQSAFMALHVNGQAFTPIQLDSANTAKSIAILSIEEKNVIRLINLARMYPKQFAKNYVAKYDEKETGYDYGADYAKDKASLITTLNKTKAMKPLVFDNEMYELAKCWCLESGKSGAVGHTRKTCKSGYNGECCSYGFDGALDIVMQLMIDNGVPGYGHRKIILTPYYSKIGIKNGSHKTYSFCSVIDFKQ